MTDDLLDRSLIRSRYLLVVPLDTGSFLCVQALQQTRAVLKREVVDLIDSFAERRRVGDWLAEYCDPRGVDRQKALHAVRTLLELKMLFPGSPETEERTYTDLLSQLFGRDPETARLAAQRWASQQVPRFAAPEARDLASFAPQPRRLDVVLVGLCEVQIGMDVLRAEARAAGIDLRLVPTFETTIEMLKQTPHDAVIVGPLGARHGVWHREDPAGDLAPERYLDAVRDLLERLRELTAAPVLVHNLPVPTCAALGFADRGADSLRERVRRIDRGLLELAGEVPDVFVVDVDAALAFEGKRRLLDDRVIPFSHLGGLGWWSLLPPIELSSVHGLRPPLERLAELGLGDPLEFDRVLAAEQVSLLCAIFGVGRRSHLAVDLDGVLWPGALAQTGAPFPPSVDWGGWSFHAFYLGIHEALKALAARGLSLAGIASGDESTLLPLWSYPSRAPVDRLLAADDFAALQIDGAGVADQLRAVARDLETAPETMVFVSTDPARREAAAVAFPGLLVLGENLFRIRGELLTHRALQVADIEGESRQPPELVRALFQRERERRAARDPDQFLASLDVRCEVRASGETDLDRVYDLVLRTNQFTTTARRFTRRQLVALAAGEGEGRMYTLRVQDRFTEYGLVGVCVAFSNTLELFLLSCRVVGLGVEHVLLRAALADLHQAPGSVRGRLLQLEHNLAARALYLSHGFTEVEDGLWEMPRAAAPRLPCLPSCYQLSLVGLRVPEGFPLAAEPGRSSSSD